MQWLIWSRIVQIHLCLKKFYDTITFGALSKHHFAYLPFFDNGSNFSCTFAHILLATKCMRMTTKQFIQFIYAIIFCAQKFSLSKFIGSLCVWIHRAQSIPISINCILNRIFCWIGCHCCFFLSFSLSVFIIIVVWQHISESLDIDKDKIWYHQIQCNLFILLYCSNTYKNVKM